MLSKFDHISFDKAAISYLFMEISNWFFLLFQFEIDDLEDWK